MFMPRAKHVACRAARLRSALRAGSERSRSDPRAPIRISSIPIVIGGNIGVVHPAFRESIEAAGKPEVGRHQIRVFYATQPARWRGLAIHGLGAREWMPPSIIDRPHGTGDYLLMAFHHEVVLSDSPTAQRHPRGTFIVWTPKHAQYYGNRERPWLHSWLHCAGKAFSQRLEAAGLPVNTPISGFDPALFEHALYDLYRELQEGIDPDEAIALDLLQILLRRVSRIAGGAPAMTQVPPPFLALKRYLEDNFPDRMTLAGLARRIPCSVPHLSSEFKRYFGLAPIEYIIKLRLHCARMLLADRSQTVGAVARSVGYDDINQFSRLFRKHYGVSPRAIRRP
jgi:AraC family transcriptional regulator of arabinose operon